MLRICSSPWKKHRPLERTSFRLQAEQLESRMQPSTLHLPAYTDSAGNDTLNRSLEVGDLAETGGAVVRAAPSASPRPAQAKWTGIDLACPRPRRFPWPAQMARCQPPS